jgi:nitrate reductase gamma subunit
MIEFWLGLARGPIFRSALVLMILGLMRHAFLTWFGILRMIASAGDRRMPYGQIFRATLLWLFPFKKLNNRLWYSVTSVVFHIGLIFTPIFLAAHILLWRRGLGVSWPALPDAAADALTMVTICAGGFLLAGRVGNRHSRAISRFQDFALPILVIVPFLTGWVASRPEVNPFSYEAVMLVHVMSGNLIIVLIPFSKLAHAILLPSAQLVSEAAWHFPADSGVKVAVALRKEVNQV